MRKLPEDAPHIKQTSHLMLESNFLKYSVKDFLLDESFQRWLIQPHNPPIAGWSDWLKQHPQISIKVEQARAMMQQLKSGLAEDASPEELQEVWIKINNSMNRMAF